jgi:hypothetical protein
MNKRDLYAECRSVPPRIGEQKHMSTFRIAAQMIAHQAVQTIKVLPHVCRACRYVNPRRRSEPEHRLTPCPIS